MLLSILTLIYLLFLKVQAEYDNPSLEVRYKFIIVRLEVLENTAVGTIFKP